MTTSEYLEEYKNKIPKILIIYLGYTNRYYGTLYSMIPTYLKII